MRAAPIPSWLCGSSNRGSDSNYQQRETNFRMLRQEMIPQGEIRVEARWIQPSHDGTAWPPAPKRAGARSAWRLAASRGPELSARTRERAWPPTV